MWIWVSVTNGQCRERRRVARARADPVPQESSMSSGHDVPRSDVAIGRVALGEDGRLVPPMTLPVAERKVRRELRILEGLCGVL